jgi:hypothetical protein
VTRPLAILLTACAAMLGTLVVATPATADDAPTAISIEGAGLSEALTLRAGTEGDLFNRLLHQVGWMATRGGDPMKPDPASLGPKYILTVSAGDRPVQRYEVYPQASGGPKAFRPAGQPRGRTADAWFYVSLSVPELLRAAGVPVTDPEATDGSDALAYRDPAGYIPATSTADSRPVVSFGDILHAQGRTLALWAGTAVLVLLLVLGAARLSHRMSYNRR